MELHYATIWEAVSDAHPDREALVEGESRWTWGDFEARSARIASALLDAGIANGSKVGQLLFNSAAFMETYFAALKIRAVPFNLNYRYVEDEIVYLLENAEAEALFYHASLRSVVANALDRVPALKLVVEVPDRQTDGAPGSRIEQYEELIERYEPAERVVRSRDDITMVFTGGTTGMPKGVMLPIGPAVEELLHKIPSLFGGAPETTADAALATVRRLQAEGGQFVVLPAAPLIHNAALAMAANPTLLFGGKLVFLAGGAFDAAELWGAVERERVRGIVIVGDAFARPMLKALDADPTGRDLGSLALIASTGAMFATEVKTGLFEHLPSIAIVDVIAATEGAMGASISTKEVPVPTGTFTPYPGVVVLTEDDQIIPAGSALAGRIAVPTVDRGYFKDAGKSAETFRTIKGITYSIPGDFAKVGVNGSLTLLGRGSTCINTAGEKVYPEEVEEVIKTHPGVDDCLVFGVADERFGQRVAAVISSCVPPSTLDVDDVIGHARTRLASYKLPRAIQIVGEVPRSDTGKADYPAARRLFEENRTATCN